MNFDRFYLHDLSSNFWTIYTFGNKIHSWDLQLFFQLKASEKMTGLKKYKVFLHQNEMARKC